MKNLFIALFALIFSFSVSAKTVVVGTGSGAIEVDAMTGLNPGDVLAIVPGTYTGASYFANLNGITITNNGGPVIFSGGNYTELESNLVNVTFTGLTFLNINNDAFLLTGTNIQGLYIYNCTFTNVTNNIIDASGYCAAYTGTTSSLKVYRAAFDHNKLINCGQVWQGFYGTPSQNTGLCDSVEMSYDTVTQTATNGTEVAGPISHINFNHWQINYTGLNPVAGDVGVFQTAGDGQIYDCYFYGGRGYLCRQLLYGLNGVGSFYFYNNIIYGQNAYGAIDIRCDPSIYGATNPYLTKANAWLYNCTMGNKTDINGYVCPVAIVGLMGSGTNNATCTIRNMFAFNNQYGANPIANNNANGTWNVDTGYDVYSTGVNALYYLQDTNSVFMPTANSYLNNNGVSMTVSYPSCPSPTPDIYGFSGNTNRIGSVYNNSTNKPTSVTANAGANQTITLPTSMVALNGSGSTASNSTITSYAWSQLSGPAVATILAPSSSITSVGGMLVAGAYIYQLKVGNSAGQFSTSQVTITVNPAIVYPPPVSNAGANQTITLPSTVAQLNGSVTDPNAPSVSASWSVSTYPTGASPVIASPTYASTQITNLTIAGTYTFILKATSVNGNSSSPVIVIVKPVPKSGNSFTTSLIGNSTVTTIYYPDGTKNTYTVSKKAVSVSNSVISLVYTVTIKFSDGTTQNFQ